MATFRERVKADGSRVFHVQVRMSGFPARTGSFPTLRLAQRWAKVVEAEMIEGRHFRSVEARRRSLGEAIDRYLREEVPKKRDGSMWRSNLPWWKDQLGNLKLADITPAILLEHRGKLARGTYKRATPNSPRSIVKGEARQFKRSPATVNRYLTALSHVFTVARKEWHWVSHNPFDGVSKLKEPRGRIRHLSEDERERLLGETAKDPILHTLVVLALETAARAGELLKLRWKDVDLKEEIVSFRSTTTKNAEPREVWLPPESARLLREHGKLRRLEDDPVFQSPSGGVYEYAKVFKAACASAKVTEFRFHDLRHTAATYAARLGAAEQQLRALGGWKSGIVSRYVHLAATDVKDVQKKMNEKMFGK